MVLFIIFKVNNEQRGNINPSFNYGHLGVHSVLHKWI